MAGGGILVFSIFQFSLEINFNRNCHYSVWRKNKPSIETNSVFGEYRSDAVYLVPFFKEVIGATLVVDYSMNRADFELGKLDTNS